MMRRAILRFPGGSYSQPLRQSQIPHISTRETLQHRAQPQSAQLKLFSSKSSLATGQQAPKSSESARSADTGKANEKPSSGNPTLPKFSLDSLGLSRNQKIIVIVLLSIFGTLETITYARLFWRWWKPEYAPEGEGKKSGA